MSDLTKLQSAEPVLITDGSVVASLDSVGRLVTTYSDRSLVVKGSVQITNTTETIVIPALGAGLFCDITTIMVSSLANSGTVQVSIRDSTNGSIVTVIPVTGGTSGLGFNFSPAIPQTTANSNWTAKLSNNVGAGVRVFMLGVQTQ